MSVNRKEAVMSQDLPLEVPTVSEELYNLTREVLKKQGLSFVVAIDPLTVGQLTADTKDQFFGRIHSSEEMKSNIPPQIEVAIDPHNFQIENSNFMPTSHQEDRAIADREKLLKRMLVEKMLAKKMLPENIRDVISSISALKPKHASILFQLDLAYRKEKGRPLFTNWFGRTDDQTGIDFNANVGRDRPKDGLSVNSWCRRDGHSNIFSVFIVVLPRKLAA